LIIFAVGIIFLFAKMVWHDWSNWFLLPAVTFIVTAHFLNFRLCRQHDHGHVEDCAH
jgi:hypothetical protein